MANQESPIGMLDKLIAFETTAGKKSEIEKAYDYIKMQCSFFPFIIQDIVVNDEHSVIFSTQKSNDYDVILCAHLDVVPAPKELFTMKVDGDNLAGRGVSDMKFAIPGFIESFKRLHKNHQLEQASLAMVITADEERGGFNGIKYLVNEKGLRGKVIVLPDGGDNWKIVQEAKGAAWINVATKGHTAHASKPWEGKNAIGQLITLLSQVQKKYPLISKETWATTVNIGTLHGGETPNQVPAAAEATLDIRYIATEPLDIFLSFLKTTDPSAIVTIQIHKQAFHIDTSNAYLALWKQLLQKYQVIKSDQTVFVREEGSADHHYFSEKGMPVIVSKPVGGYIHTDHEWLNKESYLTFIDILTEFIEQATQAKKVKNSLSVKSVK